MWIDRQTYERVRLDHEKSNTEARVLSEQNRALQVTLDWFRVRITQLELERAQLLFNYTGVKVPTPQIDVAPPADQASHPFHAVPSFNDMGDVDAAKYGVGWNGDGTLSYASTAAALK